MGVVALALTPSATPAGKHTPYEARSGVAIAQQAAQAWAHDAILVYLENDESVDSVGAAQRWGYLYYSPSTEQARVYSVRDGKILVAEYLEMQFDAPPIAMNWIDSGVAFELAEEMAGRLFRRQHQGALHTMLLMRGAFHSGDPNQTTWTVIYTSPHAPSLFVVVDAIEGKVSRTWRG
jgi:hypothetical protein